MYIYSCQATHKLLFMYLTAACNIYSLEVTMMTVVTVSRVMVEAEIIDEMIGEVGDMIETVAPA
jgi:hypothetical protein